jgi:hypothetical protein
VRVPGRPSWGRPGVDCIRRQQGRSPSASRPQYCPAWRSGARHVAVKEHAQRLNSPSRRGMEFQFNVAEERGRRDLRSHDVRIGDGACRRGDGRRHPLLLSPSSELRPRRLLVLPPYAERLSGDPAFRRYNRLWRARYTILRRRRRVTRSSSPALAEHRAKALEQCAGTPGLTWSYGRLASRLPLRQL